MSQLDREKLQWDGAELPYAVVNAPKDAVQFDKMLVVYSDKTKRTIRFVSLYNSKTDKFLARF